MRTLLSGLVLVLAGLAGPGSVVPTSASAAAGAGAAQATCQRTLATYPVIKPGTRSKAVRTLQCVLNDAGFGPVAVDGFYGPQTQDAITELTNGFECCIKNPLRVRTWYWTILFSLSHPLRGLELGDSGIRVRTLQRALRADGETLVIDGQFGPQTRAQVKVFQATCSITPSGRVNAQTAFFFSQGGCQ